MSEHTPEQLPKKIEEWIGKTLKGQYEVIKLLGHGGMGAVFKGRHIQLDRIVAIKILFIQEANLTDFEKRFRREAQLASKLTHPNIAQVYDFDIESGSPYMVMEYVEGVDLSDVIEKEKPIPPDRAMLILRELALALSAAAKKRVVHRDIKPGNIRLQNYSPEAPVRLKVLDFGLAKQVDVVDANPLTQQGAVMGTPSYMAPEQISPEALSSRARGGHPANQPIPPLDERADLYATGVIFYEMLCGQRPFQGSHFEIVTAHLFQSVKDLPSDLPLPVRTLCMHLLAKHPAERVPSADALLVALDRLLAKTSDRGRSPWLWLPVAGGLMGLAALGRCVSGGQHNEGRPDLLPRDLSAIDLAPAADLHRPEDLSVAADLSEKRTEPPKPVVRVAPKVPKPKPVDMSTTAPQKPEPDSGDKDDGLTPEGGVLTGNKKKK